MTAITATMNQWEPSQDSPEVIVNENFKTLQWSSVYACNPDTTAGLTWGYYGGEYGDFTVTAGTLTLTTATTNYIVVLRSTGVISTSTSITNWNNTAIYARVYLVTTGASTVSTVVDYRTRTNGIFYYVGSFTGGTLSSALNEAPIVTIASSTTPAIFAAAGNTISMTGTTTVTGFDTIAAGAVRRVVFTGILQLTHNATSMINLTGANITTAAGDIATFLSLGSGNTRMVGYERADGTALVTGGAAVTQCIPIACSDETTALTTGTAKVTFRMPYAFTLTEVRASVTTAPTGGTLLTVDINEGGTTILSTKLTFDASEKTTTTATTPAVISDSSLADDAEMTIDIDSVGSTIAGAGLKVYLIGYET